MRTLLHSLLPCLLGLLLLSACSSGQHNSLAYFQNLDSLSIVEGQLPDYEVKIEPQDELMIVVSSLDPEATAAYNLPMASVVRRDEIKTTNALSQTSQQTYVVNPEGDITMPVLGRIHVAGLTVLQLQKQLTTLIERDVTDPVVRVELIGFRINVIGEVKAPGRQWANSDRYSLLDALAVAGDLTEYGQREDVLLIREEGGKHVYHHFNLNDASSLASPYFFLKQNDVIVVSPNKIRQDNSKYNQNNAFKLSVISTVVSGVSVIASLVIALTVK